MKLLGATKEELLDFRIPGCTGSSIMGLHMYAMAKAYNLDALGILSLQPLAGPEFGTYFPEKLGAKRLQLKDLPVIERNLRVCERYVTKQLAGHSSWSKTYSFTQRAIVGLYTAVLPGWLNKQRISEISLVNNDRIAAELKQLGQGSFNETLLRTEERILSRMEPYCRSPKFPVRAADALFVQVYSHVFGVGADVMAAQHLLHGLKVEDYDALLNATVPNLRINEGVELALLTKGVLADFMCRHIGKLLSHQVAGFLGLSDIPRNGLLGRKKADWTKARDQYLQNFVAYFDLPEFSFEEVLLARICSEILGLSEYIIRASFFPGKSLESVRELLALDLSLALPKRRSNSKGIQDHLTPFEIKALAIVHTVFPGHFSNPELGRFFSLTPDSVKVFRRRIPGSAPAEKTEQGRIKLLKRIVLTVPDTSWTASDVYMLWMFLEEFPEAVFRAFQLKIAGEHPLNEYEHVSAIKRPTFKKLRHASCFEELPTISLLAEVVIKVLSEERRNMFPLTALAKLLKVDVSLLDITVKDPRSWNSKNSVFSREIKFQRERNNRENTLSKKTRTLEEAKPMVLNFPLIPCSVKPAEHVWPATYPFFILKKDTVLRPEQTRRCAICDLEHYSNRYPLTDPALAV